MLDDYCFFTGNHITPWQTDTIIKWSEDRKLNYDDFVGEHFSHIDSSTKYDTLAVVDCFIKYEIKTVSGKIAIHAYACIRPRTSWMKVKAPGVLKHEQGHFDLAEIYSRRFENTLNDTSINNPHDYFVFMYDFYKQTVDDLNVENNKYDIWSMNTFGKEYYFKWIAEQLSLPQ
jgi:hypothetical protein